MRYVFLWFIVFYLIHYHLSAQQQDEMSETDVLLRKEHFGGLFISSAGAGIEFRKGANVTFFSKWLYEFNLLELKDSRETRTYNPYYRNSRSYIYGKLNNLYVLRAGGGQQKLINRKPSWGGVEVRYFWFAGGSLGITKPVYLYIIKDLTLTPIYYEYTLVSERYDPTRHFIDNIYGRAPFTRGFKSLSFHPGAYAKGGLSFEIGRQNQKLSAFEIGAAFDFFPAAVPVMALRDPEHYFLTFFLGYYFGKRYN